MNVHVFYVSLLVIAAGFIGYLKVELDSNLEKFETGKQAISKNLAQLKETIKRTENELNKCKKSLSTFEPLQKEVEETKKKLSDVTQSSSACTQAKVRGLHCFFSLEKIKRLFLYLLCFILNIFFLEL